MKMKRMLPAMFVLQSCGTPVFHAADDVVAAKSLASQETLSALTFWYQQLAKTWTTALPIGNGRAGAMVFGGIDQERLQLNEATLWSDGPHDSDKNLTCNSAETNAMLAQKPATLHYE